MSIKSVENTYCRITIYIFNITVHLYKSSTTPFGLVRNLQNLYPVTGTLPLHGISPGIHTGRWNHSWCLGSSYYFYLLQN